jgi:hypothetical protein
MMSFIHFSQIMRLQCRIWGSHSSGYEVSVFWDITPCSPLIDSRHFGGTYCRALLSTCSHIGILLSLFFNPEDGGSMFLRNVIDFQQATQRYIPEDNTLSKFIIWSSYHHEIILWTDWNKNRDMVGHRSEHFRTYCVFLLLMYCSIKIMLYYVQLLVLF